MNTIMRVYSYSAKYKKTMIASIVCLTIAAVLSAVPYFIIYDIIMRFTETGTLSVQYIAIAAGAILACLLLNTYTLMKGLTFSHHLAYDTLRGMRKKVADKLLKIPLGTLERHSTGSLKKNFVENIENMELLLAHAMPEGISNIITLVILSAALFVVDWRMALATLAVVPIGIAPFFAIFKVSVKKMVPYYQASKKMNENIIEYINGMEVIKVFNQTPSSFKKYSSSVENYTKYTLDWYKMSYNYMTLYDVFLPATLLFVLPIGMVLYLGGTLSLGAFVLGILLAMSIGIPIIRLVEFFPTFPMLKHQSGKIEEFFNELELKSGERASPPKNHTVTFDHVTFAYNDLDVLHDVSLTAKKNTVTALVGESGAGKSTLAKLLVRFWDIKSGEIKIGDVNIRDLSFETLMNEISYVSQDIFLFNTTILENIRMGNPKATDDEVIKMAKLAQCHEFITETEQGYQTVVGETGDKLSGGQRQRIAIARAMLKNAPIVVLDEATSFTDPENEDKIQLALNGLIRGKTVIVIAHRLSTIVNADQIILLDSGRVSARGTHSELLATSLIYQKMWAAHRESMEWDIAVKGRSA
ncbi:MAG: ABC transporter ATP-binding protein/permease [Candidatus Bathyarchaeota archaeon]|nr:ABC transporter ATP-binding protein/permease [Candidatus Bathyarchaeota archaeon]